MSWNESGGHRNGGQRNPWERRPNGGAPDLDELVRRLQRRLRAFFRGGAPGAGGPGDRKPGPPPVSWSVLVALVVGVWIATGFYQVGAAEHAVITRFGAYVAPVIGPGGLKWHWPWPIESKQLVNTQEFLSAQNTTRVLTQDVSLVDVNMTVQYRRRNPVDYLFNVVDPEKTLADAAESAIREIIGQSTLQTALYKGGLQDMALRIQSLVQKALDSYSTGLEVISVNLQDVSVPEQVAPAQKDAIKAKSDKDRAQLEADTYAQDLLPRARGQAQQKRVEAEAAKAQAIADAQGETARFSAMLGAYERAPELTRQRMYIETVEAVLKNASKVIVDTKGTGNVLYLPIEKLLENRTPVEAARPALPEVTVTPPRSESENDSRSRGPR
jgi:membrane protease subunit HflK